MCMRSDESLDPQYLGYVTSAVPFVQWATATSEGIRMPRTSWEKIGEYRPWVPSRAEQRAIANYLDAETARIDDLIQKKRHLIELLEERKTLLAEDAIARLRNSESLVPLKHLVCESDLRYHSGSEPTMLSVSIHRGVVSRGKLTDGLPRPEDLRGYKECHPGDIVINRMRAFQGGLGVVSQTGVVSPDYTVLKVGARLSSHFLHYVMRSSWFVSEMTRRLRGIGATDQGQVRTPRINFADLGLIGVPVPPRWKQDDLAVHLANEETRLTQAVDLLAKQAVLLAERRQTVITAVMTGQVQVAAAKDSSMNKAVYGYTISLDQETGPVLGTHE